MRRSNKDGFQFNFSKAGSFGIFQSNGSVPIEYIMTSFSLDELTHLSFAKDVNTVLNFDFLIQRDIDIERAQDEISHYLVASDGELQKEVVFLPPLLVAIIGVDGKENIEKYYPDCEINDNKDDFGEIIERTWGKIFKIENYPISNGHKFLFGSEKEYLIDIEQAKLHIYISAKGVGGARLVVIDGQHRLYALKAVKDLIQTNIVVPVCIVYPSLSVSSNSENPNIPDIPRVLRSLFVDVNSKVERVSGHFLTLLSDQVLGSIICRGLCKKVLNNHGEYSLGLIEWNVKKHKESLEISRDHTITSIGVLNSALEECFSTKNGIKLISQIIGINKINFDFGEDEYGEKNITPEFFPWRDFLSRHREPLAELTSKTVVPALYDLFFTPNFVVSYQEGYQQILDNEKSIDKETRNICSIFDSLKQKLLYDIMIEGNQAKSRFNDLISKIRNLVEDKIPDFFRTVIFQKAYVEAWSIMITKLIALNFKPELAHKILVKYVEHAFKINTFDKRHRYLQDTIYTGIRLKVTKTSKRQITRLILSQGLSETLRADLIKNNLIDKNLNEVLEDFSNKESAQFILTMHNDKKKNFERTFYYNYEIDSITREKLIALDKEKKARNNININDAIAQFEILIEENVMEDYINSIQSFKNTLKLSDSWESIYLAEKDIDEDEE